MNFLPRAVHVKKVATINSAAVGKREIPVEQDVSAKAASTQ